MDLPIQRCTTRAKKLLAAAAARSSEVALATPWDILLAILRSERTVAIIVLERLGINLDALIATTEQHVSRGLEVGPRVEQSCDGTGPSAQLDADSQRALQLAGMEADVLRHKCIGTEHLLLGLISLGGHGVPYALTPMGVTSEAVRKVVTDLSDGS